MFRDHPTVEQLNTFLQLGSRTSDSSINATIIRHLLTDCDRCRHQLEQMGWAKKRLDRLLYRAASWSDTTENLLPPFRYDYTGSFEKAAESVSALLQAPARPSLAPEILLEELELLEAEQRLEKVKQDPFLHPMVIRHLVQRSHSSRYKDSELMLHYALLSRNAAEACDVERAGSARLLADLRAHGWRQLGNALRVSGQIQEAEEAFAAAQRYRREGTGDPLLRAWLLEQLASLRIFQRRFLEAVQLADEAGETYRQLGESQNLASTMVQKAIAYLYASEPESAVEVLNRAIPLIDQDRDPYLLLAACHNLILCYVDLDQPEQALSLYYEGKELYRQFEDAFILLRTAWQEGRLLRDLGHLDGAEQALVRAREGFLQRNLSYEVAVISLDLSTIYVKLGQAERVRQTVAEALPIFKALKIGREALASLLQLQKVANQEQEALGLIQMVSSHLERLSKSERPTKAN